MKQTDYLTDEGWAIYESLKAHCEKYKLETVDEFELKMLANSFDLHAKAAQTCNEEGVSQNPKEGGWAQVRPEYTVMKNEYQNILKHSGKFGLNPADRAKFFKGSKGEKKKFA